MLEKWNNGSWDKIATNGLAMTSERLAFANLKKKEWLAALGDALAGCCTLYQYVTHDLSLFNQSTM